MKLTKGKAAATKKGAEHNYETMRKAGYSKKRARGTVYGEIGDELKDRRDESRGMKKAMKSKRKPSGKM